MTGRANTARNSGFCSPPACPQMKAITTTPSACRLESLSVSRAWLVGRSPDMAARITCSAPRASSPAAVRAKSMRSPLTNQGSATASRMAHIVSSQVSSSRWARRSCQTSAGRSCVRSEEHTSELQSRFDLVCRLLLEKKKRNKHITNRSLDKTLRLKFVHRFDAERGVITYIDLEVYDVIIVQLSDFCGSAHHINGGLN